jgi:hypothetical protein
MTKQDMIRFLSFGLVDGHDFSLRAGVFEVVLMVSVSVDPI